MSERPDRLDSLTGLRWFAAAFVVLYHLVYYGVADYGRVNRLAWTGYLGVEFFFVLSGFVLVWAFQPGDSARSFYRRRFARVVPLHLLFLLPGAVLLGMGLIDVSARSVLMTVPLLEAWWPGRVGEHSLNPPDWTLSCEVFFYALFPWMAARLASRSDVHVAAVAIGAVVAMAAALLLLKAALPFEPAYQISYHYPPYRIGEFVVGMALGLLVRRGALRVPNLGVAIGLTLLTLVVLCLTPRFATVERGAVQLITLPVWALLVASAAQADVRGRASVLRHPALVKLGVWSFALYLAHVPLLMVLTVAAPALVENQGLALAAVKGVIFLVAATALAGVAHVLCEAPLERRLRGTRRPSVIQRQDAATSLLGGAGTVASDAA
jgi:peptidoglycan/LPS O-acetylase OafA/YrhL